ncbi:polyhydroxyalkanoic acid system family protein [Ahrensia sp. 13_GOM-1096m]|uniref:polyhydroxyalkanoic acid system family protein n=1 Tax=Ahrensia sp. 13_GOM-1096m TaxID=1380380 RepID=UPI000478D464|nr:polyhydroxyalkanoic acid system family protein [Ahrensia sp. 13_GOM-1096m]
MAKPVTITISHELGKDAAKSRIDGGFQKVGDRLGFGLSINQRWESDTMHFDARAMGQTIEGSLDVHETNVIITVMLPLLLAGMAETIKAKLQKESTLLLEKK